MKNEFDIVAKTIFGLEETLSEELKSIGAKNIKTLQRAVSYTGDNMVLYKSNLHLRTAIRVLVPILKFKANSERELYKGVQTINWEKYLNTNKTFAIDGTTSGEIFTHSKYAALLMKDAIVDKFRDKFDERPSIDTENPDLRINLHINHNNVTISLDSSGSNLGKRGYKLRQVFAPLSEVLASGIILLSGWDKKQDFIDPMCGSGTFSIEAALIAKNIAPGSFRKFNFENWKDFDRGLWRMLKKEAVSNEIDFNGKIMGFDVDDEAITISNENSRRAGVNRIVSFEYQDFTNSNKEFSDSHIIMNPPYGERLMEDDEIIPFYKEIGDQLKHNYTNCDAFIFSGNLRAIKHVGLKASTKIKLFNGPIECRLNKFELYAGSKKANKQ